MTSIIPQYCYPLGVWYGGVCELGVEYASGALAVIWHGLRDAFLMAWEVWWALVLGFAISAIVQAWVPRARIEAALSGSGPRPVAGGPGVGRGTPCGSHARV